LFSERIQQVNSSITGLCALVVNPVIQPSSNKTVLTSVSSSFRFAESVVERGSVLHLLDAKTILSDKLRECDQALGPDLHPVEDKHIVFYSEPRVDVLSRIDSFGKVYSVDIKKCSATGNGLARAILNKKVTQSTRIENVNANIA